MRSSVALACAVYLFVAGGALAQASKDDAELVSMVRALQARVTQLEAQLGKEKPRSENRNKPSSAPVSRLEPEFRPASAIARDELESAPPLKQPNRWGGFYWGTSFGGAMTEGRVTSRDRYISAAPANSPPFNINGVSSLGQSGRDSGIGAVIDLYSGVNVAVGSFIGGVQIEGSIGDLSFNSKGARNYTYFDANGSTGNTATGDFRPHVHARWMVSVLARGGFLLDADTLGYAIGGLSGAMFDYVNVTENPFYQPDERYWALGMTVGGGIERKMGGGWSIKGEYRYTHFPEVAVSNNFSWTAKGPTFNFTQTNEMRTRFENELHALRIGMTYSFGSQIQ